MNAVWRRSSTGCSAVSLKATRLESKRHTRSRTRTLSRWRRPGVNAPVWRRASRDFGPTEIARFGGEASTYLSQRARRPRHGLLSPSSAGRRDVPGTHGRACPGRDTCPSCAGAARGSRTGWERRRSRRCLRAGWPPRRRFRTPRIKLTNATLVGRFERFPAPIFLVPSARP